MKGRGPDLVFATSELVDSVGLLTLRLCREVLGCDWSDPEMVQHAGRLMRVLSAYGRNVEKCIVMTNGHVDGDVAAQTEQDAQELRDHLYRELTRYAERLGPDELARRYELDIADAGGHRVEILESP